MRGRVLILALAVAAAVLVAAPASAQSQSVPGLACPTGEQVYVVTHYPELRAELDPSGAPVLRLTLTCGPGGELHQAQRVPFAYTVDTTLDALILEFTVQGASGPSSAFLAVTDSSQVKAFDKLARQLERARTAAEEARLLNELLALLSV